MHKLITNVGTCSLSDLIMTMMHALLVLMEYSIVGVAFYGSTMCIIEVFLM